MQMDVRSHRLELAPEARRTAERRVRLVLGRLAAGVDRASITLLAGETGFSRDGHRCRIRARLREGSSVIVEDAAMDIATAAEKAAWRLEHFLDRKRARERMTRLRA